jgi:hypothetical protein
MDLKDVRIAGRLSVKLAIIQKNRYVFIVIAGRAVSLFKSRIVPAWPRQGEGSVFIKSIRIAWLTINGLAANLLCWHSDQ